MNKKTIPFNLFTALKIQAGIVKGRFITRSGHAVRILCYDAGGPFPIVALVNCGSCWDKKTYTLEGGFFVNKDTISFDLLIELEEEGEK